MSLPVSTGIFSFLHQSPVAADNTCQKAYKPFIPAGTCKTSGECFQLWQQFRAVTLASITVATFIKVLFLACKEKQLKWQHLIELVPHVTLLISFQTLSHSLFDQIFGQMTKQY